MKKVIWFILAACLATQAFAEGEPPFVFTAKTNLSLCVAAAYFTPAVGLAWQPGLIGVGAEARCLVGLSEGDVYLVGFGLLKISYFFAGIGLEAPVKLVPGADSASVLPAFTIGMDLPLLPIGPGTLGINGSLDWIWTSIESDEDDTVGKAFAELILDMIGATKLSLGVVYSIRL